MSRKSSFHEIQLKFRSLERKQREKKEIERKLEKCLKEGSTNGHNGGGEWPKSDRDTGYVSRDKSRSRDDFLPDSPQESLLNNPSSSAKRLESYLIRQARAADDFDAADEGGNDASHVQASHPKP